MINTRNVCHHDVTFKPLKHHYSENNIKYYVLGKNTMITDISVTVSRKLENNSFI